MLEEDIKGWELRGLHCYKFFSIKHSWENAAQLCSKYGSELVLVESYAENNFTAGFVTKNLGPADRRSQSYWLGLSSLDDLRTNTLESAGGVLVSQYSGYWSLAEPNPTNGECVDVSLQDEHQSWQLQTCETLLPFLCRATACPTGSYHCSNGKCVNSEFRCDKQNDCGDWSDELDCPSNCHYYMASSGDVVESPNYPQKYEPLSNCKWTLEGPQGHNILLQFQEFDTEKSFDTVQILIGGRTEEKATNLATLSGKLDLSNKRFVSASNFMIVKFSTDSSVERRGFRASWKTEPQICGGNLRAATQPQTLMSPGYPNNYPSGLECLYTISAQPGRVVTLEIDDIEIEKNRDYILVRDGDGPKSPLMGRLTGTKNDNPKILISTGSDLYLYLKTNLGESRRGFKIKYVQGCKATIVGLNGTITSPSFGLSAYPSNLECLIRVKNPTSGPLSLKFDFMNVHPSDVVQVFDGGSTSGLRLHPNNGFNGITPPKLTMTASSGELLVRFVTDALHNSKGWQATFSADCPMLRPGEGALASNRDTTFGTAVTFTCPVGQEFSTGKSKLVTECLIGGNWSISYIPKCQEVYCGPVPQIDNGFSIGSSNVTYRGLAYYQCYAGFGFPSGHHSEKISCLADGRWERLPSCQASQCPPLPETPHANSTLMNGSGRSYGTIVRFDCEPGFVRNGHPVLLCMSNGTWSNPVPTCTRAECPVLPEIANGFLVDSTKQYYFSDEARVQCHKGFKLVSGSSVIKCGTDQKFSNVPKCEDINECLTSQCDSASTECVNTIGGFYCRCRNGFAPNLECRPVGDLGLVSGAIPDESITVSNSATGFSKENIRLSSMRGWCGDGTEPGTNWVLFDLKSPTIVRGFRTQGVLRATNKFAFTTAIRIQYTNNMTDIFKEYTNPDGTPVEFRVLEPTLSILNLPIPIEAQYVKFKIQDYVGAPCLRLEIMGCSRLECMDINECAHNNGGCDQKCINSPGNYSCGCNIGYELFVRNGTAGFFVHESESGERDGDVYQRNKTCVPVMCPKLIPPENGIILSTKDSYHFGDIVSFQCDFGHIMAGASSLMCTSSGTWNGTVPQCQYAKCVSLPDDKNEGLTVIRPDKDSVLVPFKGNVTLKCGSVGRHSRGTATSTFRQCVYDPKLGLPDYWLSGVQPSCPRIDCGPPPATPGAEYGNVRDTKFNSFFYFGCQETFNLVGQTEKSGNLVRCEADGTWNFGDLRCEGPVCEDPGRPVDGYQLAHSYEQNSEVQFGCNKPGYILINSRPITCIREPECKVIKPLGLTSGRIPDSAINATSERPNYEARNIRLNSVTGWCGKQEAFTYVSVDLGHVYRIKAILVKGVVTNDIVGRPTEIRFFYKQAESDNFVVYFPNFNLTMRDPGNYGELAMITLPKYVQARFVILGIVSYMDNACLKFELMGCEEPKIDSLLGYDYGYSPCVDNEPPIFQNCPSQRIIVRKGPQGIEPVNMTEPVATDNSGSIARMEVKPHSFKLPHVTFHDMAVKYIAFDYDGNVAICEINITVADETPPQLSCPQSYVFELIEKQDSYLVNFNESRGRINVSDASGEVFISYVPDRAFIKIGEFENVTVHAVDKFGNRATCYFQVSVQATPCVDWELQPPANGALNCLPGDKNKNLECIATCNKGFRFTDGQPVKTFMCEPTNHWTPSSVVPDCVSEDTQQADYHFVPSITYRANGAVESSCLTQYSDLVAEYYSFLNSILTQRCSAVNVNMNVSFIDSKPALLDDNVVQIDYILGVLPAVRQPQLYDLCGSTLNLIFDLSVPYASAAVEPLLNISAVGNQCPPLRALRSTIARGFSCNIGEVLNMDPNQVPRCLHCPAGTSAGLNQKSCTLCPRGFYQDRDRQGACIRCPSGTYTKDEGSKSESECVPVCGFGTYSPTGLVPCLECPRNSYTTAPPLGGYKECHSCPINTFTYQPSAPNKDFCRAKCSPGQYSETGLAPCFSCPANFYQPLTGQTICLECPSSTKTKGIGSAGREECQNVVCTDSSCLHGGLCMPMGHMAQCLCPAGFSGRRCEIDIDECASQPCYNNGICVDLPQGYRCQCRNGYSGINCQEEKSDCKNDTCPQRAMCKDEPGFGNYTCLCRSGYTGESCDITVNPCVVDGNPCKNDGKCTALKQGRYKCDCPPGWEGQHCEINIDDCAERPCLLGAPCTDLVADFKCSCPPGFTGKRCETKINLCSGSPCENGICIDKLFNYQCICNPGWTGPACDINIDECESSPCMNGGECTDLVNDFKCTCDVFYSGKRCQHLVDDCSSHPCENGGSCVDMLDGFMCNCRPGFVGLQCEAEIDECLNDPCSPEGTERCLDLDNEFKCVCHPGYTGQYCQIDIDDCVSKPCLNGGKCVDGINKYTCKCPPGWTGGRCESDITTCHSRPCLNDAKCINLFEDFFCVCPSGTDGKQCETAPERCIGNPCMHNGKCQDFGSGLNCTCSADYTGIGCQYEFDACQANVCQNGATCIDNGVGYSCICSSGFTGQHCEEDVIDCKENSCPPTATCIDLTDKFYCQCPFNLTGDDCRKTIQVDYDLSFSESGLSSAALSVPFRFDGSRQSLTIAMWVQFSHRDETGVFFTLYSVTWNRLVSGQRILVQAHSSGVQVSIFPEIQDVFLPFQEYATINDGQWHHVAVVWHQGVLTLVTEGLIASKVEGYGAGKTLPEFGWVVLGKPKPDSTKSYTESGFQGYLSKVQIWGRALDVTNEIQKQVRDCRTEPVLYQGLILTWSGYDEVQGGVERIVPSQCSHHVCPTGYTGSQCDQLQQDKVPPKVEYCPGDLWIVAKNGTAPVMWDIPKFSDNIGVVRVEEKSNHHPGQILMWGNYHIAYVAFDAAGNAAVCSFKVYVLSEFCPTLADPIGGTQQCKDWGYGGQFKVCEISCNAGLRFSEPVPKFYTCAAEGFWRPTTDPSKPMIYPACSVSKPAQRMFKVNMKFPTSVLCNEAGQGVLRQKARNAINSLNREWNFCSYSMKGTRECKELNIDVKCEHRTTRAADPDASYKIDASLPVKREKRQSSDTYRLQITFPAVNDPVSNLNSNQRATVQQLLEKSILEENQLDVHDILPNTVPDPASLQLDSDYACPAGQVVMPPDCVPCAVGTYFDKDTNKCIPCSSGTFQSEMGQMQCTACPVIAGRQAVTVGEGARNAAECKERCPAGKYYDEEAGLCRSCGHGFYQPNEGSFKCLLCGLGKTTRTTDATSAEDCRDECNSGMQLAAEGDCELCPRGTYRTQGIEPACQKCPIGRTTPKLAATTIEECSLPVCLPGTYLNGTLNACVPCKRATYQPNHQQTSCLPCPLHTSTKNIGSMSLSDCWNPCHGNRSEIQCHQNAICMLIPETNEVKCECRLGFNGTGKYCTDVCEGFCDNKGSCVKDNRGNPSCQCLGSFIGIHCEEKSDFAYIAAGVGAAVVALIIIALFIWMICARSEHTKEPKKLIAQTNDQTGSQVNFYYGAAPYAESIAPSHHSTYAHYYDDEEDGWEMPNYYNETYMKETFHHNGGKMNSLARSNASIYGTKDDLYDRLKRHAYPGKKDKSDSESEGQ